MISKYDAVDTFVADTFHVESDKVRYSADHIHAEYEYQSTSVESKDGKIKVTPTTDCFEFQTDRKVPKLGIMLVGLGGNNGTTFTAGIIANRKNISWQTKEREIKANYLGSLTQASTVRLGANSSGDPVYVPLKNLLPMVEPNDVEIGGWDISGVPLGDAMKKSKVLDVDLQRQVYDDMQKIVPLPSVYFPSFIAANQRDRADHVLKGSKQEQMEQIRKDIRDFKAAKGCDKIIVLWTANTERFAEVSEHPTQLCLPCTWRGVYLRSVSLACSRLCLLEALLTLAPGAIISGAGLSRALAFVARRRFLLAPAAAAVLLAYLRNPLLSSPTPVAHSAKPPIVSAECVSLRCKLTQRGSCADSNWRQ